MSLQLKTDKQLIDCYLSGSHSSFEILVHRHKKRVFSYIFMIVKDKHLADDLFQDTFLKVVNSLRSGCYKDRGKFLPWVLCIAHNIIMVHFRIAKRKPYLHSIENRELFDLLHIMDYPIEDKLIVEQILKNVKNLLEYLPPAQKEVIVMYHYCEMNFREIAEELDISINTVIGRMRYGLKNMREIIDQKQMIMSP